MTFSFDAQAQGYLSDCGSSAAYQRNFKVFYAKAKAMTLQALGAWDAESGIHFLQVAPGRSDTRFGNYDFDKGLAGSSGVAA